MRLTGKQIVKNKTTQRKINFYQQDNCTFQKQKIIDLFFTN